LQEAVALVSAFADGLAEVNVQTLRNKLFHVAAEALVDTMAYRLSLVQ